MVTAVRELVTSVGLPPGQIEVVSTLLASFLMTERERCYRLGVPLNDVQKRELSGYFRDDLLDTTRVHSVSEPLRDPDFYPDLEKMGITNLPSFVALEAITFVDVIVFAESITNALLFHELVHAEQFRQLGVPGFARRYVGGFLKMGAYEAIPLEIQAYGLGAQYESDPLRRFSVEEEVNRWITEGKF